MSCTAEPRDWNAPFISDTFVNGHSTFRTRDVLDRSAKMHYASVVVAHELFVCFAPSRKIRWERVVPKVYRRLNEVISQHAPTDNAGVVVVELESCYRDSWPNAIEDAG